jgi:glycerate kinase
LIIEVHVGEGRIEQREQTGEGMLVITVRCRRQQQMTIGVLGKRLQ